MEWVEIQKAQVSTQRETYCTQRTSPVVTETTRNPPPHNPIQEKEVREKVHKMFKPKHSHSLAQVTVEPIQPWHFNPENLGTGRPHLQCSACGGNDHFRRDC